MDSRFYIIRKTLWDLNIPPTYLGAHYLAYAELLVLEDQDRLTMVTKWLYPEVASHYHTSWKAVERNIRTVISTCWAQDKGARLSRALGIPFAEKPSPTGIIQLLAYYFLAQPEGFWQTASTGQMSLWPEQGAGCN